jgi:hypothetical protein
MDPSISSRMTRRHIRFVLVNGRTPSSHSLCVVCCKPIGMSYLREIGTQLSYGNPGCYADHCKSAVLTSATIADQRLPSIF